MPGLIQIEQALFCSFALFPFLAFFRQYHGRVTLLALFFLRAARVFLQDEIWLFDQLAGLFPDQVINGLDPHRMCATHATVLPAMAILARTSIVEAFVFGVGRWFAIERLAALLTAQKTAE